MRVSNRRGMVSDNQKYLDMGRSRRSSFPPHGNNAGNLDRHELAGRRQAHRKTRRYMFSKPISSFSLIAGIAGTFLLPAIVAITSLSVFGSITVVSILVAVVLFTATAAGLTFIFYKDVVHLADHLYRVSSDLDGNSHPPPVRTEIARFMVAAVTRLRAPAPKNPITYPACGISKPSESVR